MEQSTVNGAQTLLRGLAFIQAGANSHINLSSIGKAIGRPRSATLRLVSTLVKAVFLRQNNSLYSFGTKLLAFGFQVRGSLSPPQIARPYPGKLANETLDTIHVAVEKKFFTLIKFQAGEG